MNERSERLARVLSVPLLIAALLTIPVVVIEQAHASEAWKHAAAVTNWVIWSAFAIETVAMLLVVPDRRGWLRGHLLEVAIVLLTPPFLPSSLQAARLFRLLRLLRLVWLVKFARELVSVEGVRYAALLAGFTALGGGAALDRKSTRLNSSHEWISYAVFCLKKKKQNNTPNTSANQQGEENLPGP